MQTPHSHNLGNRDNAMMRWLRNMAMFQSLDTPQARSSRQFLSALQHKPTYAGTVPAATVAKRRRRNKLARIARRAQRQG